MHASRTMVPTGALLAVLLAGCIGDGGRGSSGFDITENIIINRVLETQECLSNEALTFCPADQQSSFTPTPTPTEPVLPITATPTPTVEPSPQVNTGLANGASIVCTRPQPNAPCVMTFTFSASGFPDDATYYVASRLRSPDRDWMLAAAPSLNTSGTTPMLDAVVNLPVPPTFVDPRAQFAVLIFLTSPAGPPASFQVLAESGADFAFVTAEFALEVVTLVPEPTVTETATEDIDVTPSPTPSAATPTATATATAEGPRVGPVITYFGMTRADSVSLAPSDFDSANRPIYVRPFGSGLSLVVEGRPGTSQVPVGRNAFNLNGLPDLQMIISRPLGDGSTVVCDRFPPTLGGVPATVPFAFSTDPASVAAINDLGCRTDDGQGVPQSRTRIEACTLDRFGEFDFVDQTTTAQFCLPIAGAWAFPGGDTLIAARLRDSAGNLGPERQIILRNADVALPTATVPNPTGTNTRPPTLTRTPVSTSTSLPTGTPPTPSVTPTPTPSFTAGPNDGPSITYFGLARADDFPIASSGSDSQGRPIFATRLGQGVSLLVEARPGPRRLPVGPEGYSDEGLPDLQLIASQPLGDGNPAICDTQEPLFGGVAATVPLVFSGDPQVVDAINDFGCRVNDGTGATLARLSPNAACTRSDEGASGFDFVDPQSSAQFCLPIARAWAFPVGDTVVAARVRDVAGAIGPARAIVVRVRR